MIEISELAFAYEGREKLFRRLDLHLGAGDCVLLQGENGSGKSTLLKLIIGLLKPARGKINVAGKVVNGLSAEHFKHLHYQSQDTAENIMGMSPQDDWEIWRMALPQLPAREFTASPVFSAMSAGQQKQHAQLILPYLTDRFWLLDEPFAALDKTSCQALYNLLAEHHARGGGMLLIAHELQPAAEICNRVLELKQGLLMER